LTSMNQDSYPVVQQALGSRPVFVHIQQDTTCLPMLENALQ
jgi:hypothetical protein